MKNSNYVKAAKLALEKLNEASNITDLDEFITDENKLMALIAERFKRNRLKFNTLDVNALAFYLLHNPAEIGAFNTVEKLVKFIDEFEIVEYGYLVDYLHREYDYMDRGDEGNREYARKIGRSEHGLEVAHDEAEEEAINDMSTCIKYMYRGRARFLIRNHTYKHSPVSDKDAVFLKTDGKQFKRVYY